MNFPNTLRLRIIIIDSPAQLCWMTSNIDTFSVRQSPHRLQIQAPQRHSCRLNGNASHVVFCWRIALDWLIRNDGVKIICLFKNPPTKKKCMILYDEVDGVWCVCVWAAYLHQNVIGKNVISKVEKYVYKIESTATYFLIVFRLALNRWGTGRRCTFDFFFHYYCLFVDALSKHIENFVHSNCVYGVCTVGKLKW